MHRYVGGGVPIDIGTVSGNGDKLGRFVEHALEKDPIGRQVNKQRILPRQQRQIKTARQPQSPFQQKQRDLLKQPEQSKQHGKLKQTKQVGPGPREPVINKHTGQRTDLYSVIHSRRRAAQSAQKRVHQERETRPDTLPTTHTTRPFTQSFTQPTTQPTAQPVTHVTQPSTVPSTVPPTKPAFSNSRSPSRPQPDSQGKSELARLYKLIQEQIKKSHADELQTKSLLDQQARVDQELGTLRDEIRRRRDDEGRNHQEICARDEVLQLRETLAELRKDKSSRFHCPKENIEKARTMEMVVLCQKKLKSCEEEINYESNKNAQLSSQVQHKYDSIRSYSAKLALYQQEINLLNSELDNIERQASHNIHSLENRGDRPNFNAERFEALVQQRMDLQNDLQKCLGKVDEKRRREITNSIESLTHLIDSMKRGY